MNINFKPIIVKKYVCVFVKVNKSLKRCPSVRFIKKEKILIFIFYEINDLKK